MISRRQLAAEVMLVHRLKNLLRINDTTEIDTCYISCAEYQLFLDDVLRQVGKSARPDHWLQNNFPKGQALRPISGVRPTQAESFCRWLNSHFALISEATSRIRLPTFEEALAYPVRDTSDLSMLSILHASTVGAWCKNAEGFFEVVGISPTAMTEYWLRFASLLKPQVSPNIPLRETFNKVAPLYLEQIEQTYLSGLDPAVLHERVKDFQFDFGEMLSVNVNLDGSSTLALNLDDVYLANQVLDEFPDINKAITKAYAKAFREIFDLAFGALGEPILNRARFRARARSLTKSTPLIDKITNRVLGSAFDREFVKSIGRKLGNTHVMLILLSERVKGNLPAWEGIRIVRERIAKI